MERSDKELVRSIVALELVLDAVKCVVKKERLSSSDEEHVIMCLHPTLVGTDEVELMFSSPNVAEILEIVTKVPEKREVPKLQSLVELELNETFSLMDKLDNAAGFNRGKLLTEEDIFAKVNQTHYNYTNLIADSEKLIKRSKVTSKFVMDLLDPVVNSLSALKLKAQDELSEGREKERSALNQIFNDLPNDALERLVEDVEEEIKARTPEVEAQVELSDVDSQKLNDLEQEIEMKKALLATFIS